jgi:predicted TIM-barrel fold metal-dependent hydrolase
MTAIGSIVMHAGAFSAAATDPGADPPPFTGQELNEFSALEPIDTHTHIYKSDPAFFAMLKKLHLHILDIVDVSDNGDPERTNLKKEQSDVFTVANDSHGHAAVCTTFDAYRFNDSDFQSIAIKKLDESFKEGAIAVKVWKNVGMEVKDAQGNYILPDQPALEPIYRDIAKHHKTLVTHVADPDTAWEPFNPDKSDSAYFIQNPQWYMYKIPNSPSKAQILRARDHVLAMNPDLRVVGAHLGSMESDVTELAQHLDRYPNFAVDLAARVDYLAALPPAAAIAFITKYQDRLIYGTDDSIYPQMDAPKAAAGFEESYANDWRFLATHENARYGGHIVEGIALPAPILRKLYHDNAVRWFPGILGK